MIVVRLSLVVIVHTKLLSQLHVSSEKLSFDYTGAETREMASGTGVALPEVLRGEDAKSWFKRFEVCAAANGWNDEKKLRRVPTLLQGRAWAVYDSLTDDETDTYAHLKEALMQQLCPDTDEERLIARGELSRRRLKEGQESIDELARDIERLLDKASPDLPNDVKKTELRFHLINALPERVAFQLKLLPKGNYRETIAKAKELWLMYNRADKIEQTSQLSTDPGCERLDKLEKVVQQVSEQMAVLGRQLHGNPRPPNHRRQRDIECYRCGKRGHIARNCWHQENYQGNTSTRRARGAPHQQ